MASCSSSLRSSKLSDDTCKIARYSLFGSIKIPSRTPLMAIWLRELVLLFDFCKPNMEVSFLSGFKTDFCSRVFDCGEYSSGFWYAKAGTAFALLDFSRRFFLCLLLLSDWIVFAQCRDVLIKQIIFWPQIVTKYHDKPCGQYFSFDANSEQT